jgi:phosphonate transport system substrate-binding protein
MAEFMMNKLLIGFLICLIVFVDCTQAESKQAEENKQNKVLVIGLIPEQNIFKQLERYTPLADYLYSKTDLKIKLKVLTRYGNIIDNFASLKMDGAFFGSFTYALARRKLGVNVLARPEGLDGKSTYHGLIFVRKNGGIKSIKDMKGKRFVFVDKATTAGYIFPLAYFKQHGVENFPSYFKETYFAGTHEDAIYDVLNKRADIGAAKNTIFDRLSSADANISRALNILAISPDVPENGLAVSASVPAHIKISLQNSLLNMHHDPVGKKILNNFGAQKFVLTRDRDYEPVFRFALEVGLDLARYDYVNR